MFDPDWAMRHPGRAAWMGLAGPGANFALAAIGVGLLKLGLTTSVLAPAAGDSGIFRLASAASPVVDAIAVLPGALFFENLLLGIWNLLPIPPMDGFSGLLLVVRERKVESFFAVRRGWGCCTRSCWSSSRASSGNYSRRCSGGSPAPS